MIYALIPWFCSFVVKITVCCSMPCRYHYYQFPYYLFLIYETASNNNRVIRNLLTVAIDQKKKKKRERSFSCFAQLASHWKKEKRFAYSRIVQDGEINCEGGCGSSSRILLKFSILSGINRDFRTSYSCGELKKINNSLQNTIWIQCKASTILAR